jgi:hypothetical protein
MASIDDTLKLKEYFINKGLRDGELTFSNATHCMQYEFTDFNQYGFSLAQIISCFIRAVSFCYGEYVANYYETPLPNTKDSIYDPCEKYKEKFDLDMNR